MPRLGIWLPAQSLTPGGFSEWERGGGIDDMVSVAVAAEAAGYDFVCCAEHVALPTSREDVRGSRYWDPLATLGYMAAQTTRVQLVPFVVVLGYHHPLAVAKRYGTLDAVSKGRVVLGVGVGTLEEEFALLGAPFEGRGDRADDALRAIRAARGERVPEYHGTSYSYEEMIVEPTLRAGMPVWVGGRTARSLRRAYELGEGWAPLAPSPEWLAEVLARPRARAALDAREAPLEVIPSNTAVDPLGDPDGTRRLLGALVGAGATGFVPRVPSTSATHMSEQYASLAALVAAGL